MNKKLNYIKLIVLISFTIIFLSSNVEGNFVRVVVDDIFLVSTVVELCFVF